MHRVLLICAVAMLLSSCIGVTTQRSVPPCPPPPAPPACMPGFTNTVVYDTSRMMGNVRWSIRRVLGASSSTHEWGLLPGGGTNLLVIGRKPAQASYRTARIDRSDVITVTALPGKAPLLITQVPEGAITGDASIYMADIKDGVATAQTALADGINAVMFWDGHPTVSRDGKTLVFASDRDGGEGGTDLWYCKRSVNGWTRPRLVGGLANSPCDELCPQFAGDSVLLFSSAGHSTVGGYDLFSATIDNSDTAFAVGEPRNLGPPVNTSFDELFPVWYSSNTLYYSSDQPSRNSKDRKDFDVFVLTSAKLSTKQEPDKPEDVVIPDVDIPAPSTVTITGTVIREDTKQPVSGADVTATSPEDDVVVATTTSDSGGRYFLNVPPGKPVDIQAQTPELFFDKVRVDVPLAHTPIDIPIRNIADTVRIAEPLSLPLTFVLRVNFPTSVYDKPYPNVLDNNGMETSRTWESELDELANNIKQSGARLKRLVLIGHTDDVDTDANNLVLGQNRVNFIIDQLTHRGVEKSILEGRSAGESLLPDRRAGESIILWRKRARRVELVKVMQE